ncbi:MAG: hypothetical protein ACK5AZ_11665 [Bryobacteraceae bacterium]
MRNSEVTRLLRELVENQLRPDSASEVLARTVQSVTKAPSPDTAALTGLAAWLQSQRAGIAGGGALESLIEHAGMQRSASTQLQGHTARRTGAPGGAEEGDTSPIRSFANQVLRRTALGPVVTSLAGLFGRRDTEPEPAIERFSLPPSIRYEGAVSADTGGQIHGVDYVSGGQPRLRTGSAATQVTVHVNAIDSKSFLDHSDSIARAVREAMLNSHSLNDVVMEL